VATRYPKAKEAPVSRVIYKYPLQVQDEVAVALPRGAELLDVQAQDDTPCLWALVETEANTEQRVFCIFGTGHRISALGLRYIATCQLHGEMLVLHVFEKVS
jgi:hypothetical protein